MKKSVTIICIIVSGAILTVFGITARNWADNRNQYESKEEVTTTEQKNLYNTLPQATTELRIEETTTGETTTGETMTGETTTGETMTGETTTGETTTAETTTAETTTEEPASAASDGQESETVLDADGPFSMAEMDYFADALFIGDSRTVGLRDYASITGATFFAGTGMSVYNIHSGKVIVGKLGKMSFEELLGSKQFGKIYIMLGINELGYPQKSTVKKYGELVKEIRNLQPEAIIFIQANLHVTAERSTSDTIFNNPNINTFNSEIAKIADGESIFYIDVNEFFDDDNGNLKKEYAADNTHVMGKYYADWRNWLQTKAVIK